VGTQSRLSFLFLYFLVKTTDENLTTENWELILNLCDKVNDEGPDGAHQVLLALLKRLAHRNPNVQLYTLTLAEALSKNCGIEVHRELASRAWTGGLEKVVVDRVRNNALRFKKKPADTIHRIRTIKSVVVSLP